MNERNIPYITLSFRYFCGLLSFCWADCLTCNCYLRRCGLVSTEDTHGEHDVQRHCDVAAELRRPQLDSGRPSQTKAFSHFIRRLILLSRWQQTDWVIDWRRSLYSTEESIPFRHKFPFLMRECLCCVRADNKFGSLYCFSTLPIVPHRPRSSTQQ